MRIYVAGLITETNTFAPFPTGTRGFLEGGQYRGDAAARDPSWCGQIVRTWQGLAVADGNQLVEGLITLAQPSGTTVRSVYEAYRDEILQGLRENGPFDVVLLFLHGAMVAEGYDDCEGDLLRRVRELAGPGVKIGVELDPHCHLTQAMTDSADVVILMKEYPHIDGADRARELYTLCTRAARGEIRPVSAVFDCRIVGFYPTTAQPMRGLVDQMYETEKLPGVLSVSFAHGFPWADVADVGSRMLVIADGDEALAAATAERLGRRIYALRDELAVRFPGIEVALAQAAETPGRIVMADTADNPGGGAAGDDTRLLAAMLARGVTKAVAGCFWDPVAVEICAEAGVGARLQLRVGGKAGVSSGAPLDLDVVVRGVVDDHSQGGLGDGARQMLGRAVWIEAAGIDIALVSQRTQTFAPDAFTGLGIDLEGKRLIAVKSSQHFQAGFAPIADRVIQVATPGALSMDFAAMPYSKRDPNYYPRVNDPLAVG